MKIAVRLIETIATEDRPNPIFKTHKCSLDFYGTNIYLGKLISKKLLIEKHSPFFTINF